MGRKTDPKIISDAIPGRTLTVLRQQAETKKDGNEVEALRTKREPRGVVDQKSTKDIQRRRRERFAEGAWGGGEERGGEGMNISRKFFWFFLLNPNFGRAWQSTILHRANKWRYFAVGRCPRPWS